MAPVPPQAMAIEAAWRCFRAVVGDEAVDDDWLGPGEALIRRHGLAPLAYAAGASSIRRDYVSVLFDAEGRTRVVDEVIAVLAGARVPVLLLKGCAYVGDIYTDPALRPMGDVDLLVPQDHAHVAIAAMAAIGFRDGTRHGATIIHHAAQLYRDADRRSVDVHRDILQPWRSRIDLSATWARAIPATDHRPALRLDPIDQLLWHWAHMGRSELWVPLIAYVDAVRLERRLDPGQRAELDRRARRAGLRRMAIAASAMTEALVHGTERPRVPGWGRVLPSAREIIAGAQPHRAVQLARKAALNDGLLQLAGLGAVFTVRRALARIGVRVVPPAAEPDPPSRLR